MKEGWTLVEVLANHDGRVRRLEIVVAALAACVLVLLWLRFG